MFGENDYGQLAEGSADVDAYLRAQSLLCSGPLLVLTFSARYGFPTMSGYSAAEGSVSPGSQEARSWLDGLRDRLATTTDLGTAVLGFIRETVGIDAVVVTPLPRRPGELAIAVSRPENDAAVREVQSIVRAITTSRGAEFHLENGIDLTLRQAASPSSQVDVVTTSNDLPALDLFLHAARLDRLVSEAAAAVSVGALRVYEESEGRATAVTKWHPEVGLLVDSVLDLPENVETPPPPAADTPTSLTALIQASWRRRRRLSGIVESASGRFLVLTLPYGIDIRTDRPAGVLCQAVKFEDASALGHYETVFGAHLATWLARIAAERRLATSIANLAQQLSLIANAGRRSLSRNAQSLDGISGLSDTHLTDVVARCDERLQRRKDVQLLLESLPRMFVELRKLCSPASCTFRLVSADNESVPADRQLDDRWLRRVYSDGGEEWGSSPWALPLSSWHSSVIGWVARHGLPVYLRSLPEPPTKIDLSTCPDLGRYSGLHSVAMFRNGIRSELCVPVFAEDRLVGTLNIESSSVGAFDEVALSVEQYAQVIGVALLEARRRIAVDVMEAAGGFLDVRHDIDGQLQILESELGSGAIPVPPESCSLILARLNAVRDQVFLKAVVLHEHPPMTLRTAVSRALKSAKSAYAADPAEEFFAEVSDDVEHLLDLELPGAVAGSLCYALSQAFYNVRRHGRHRLGLKAEKDRGWHNPIRLHVYHLGVGGVPNLVVRIGTLLEAEFAMSIDTALLFREPMVDPVQGRVRLGAYLAGEVLRRCGGAAGARLGERDERFAVLEVEFAVPVASLAGTEGVAEGVR